MARVGTGNPFLSRTSLRFLWISLTFHSRPDLCLHTDFCMRAFPGSPLQGCGSTPAKKNAGRVSASVCPEPEQSLQGNLLSRGARFFQAERRGTRTCPAPLGSVPCCASGLRGQRAAPSHPWDPRGSACDGEAAGKALEQLIWDPGDTSQQRKSRDGGFAAKALSGEPQAPAQQAQQHKGRTQFSLQKEKGSTTSSAPSPPNRGAADWGDWGTRSPSLGQASRAGCSRQHPIKEGHSQHHEHMEQRPAMPSEAGGHEDGGDTAFMSPFLGGED